MNILVWFFLHPKVMHNGSFYWQDFLECLKILHKLKWLIVSVWKCCAHYVKGKPMLPAVSLEYSTGGNAMSEENINQQLLSQHCQLYLILKKSFVEVPWDVINCDLTSYFQLWKIHQKLKNMKAKKQLKKRQWESHTFVICKVYYWCYLIKLPKS